MWGNDPGGPPIEQSWINPDAPDYALAHLGVDVADGGEQGVVFFRRAGDAVFLAEQGNVEIVGRRHAGSGPVGRLGELAGKFLEAMARGLDALGIVLAVAFRLGERHFQSVVFGAQRMAQADDLSNLVLERLEFIDHGAEYK